MASWLIGLLALLAGVGIGYLLFQNLERRKTGGKTAAEIMQEHKEYREEVQQHFSKTSDLFQSVTMQYRELYDHLSHGAQALCDTIPASPALDLSDKALLPGAAPRPDAATKSDVGLNAQQSARSDDDAMPTAGSASEEDDSAIGADASIAIDTSVPEATVANTAPADTAEEPEKLSDSEAPADTAVHDRDDVHKS